MVKKHSSDIIAEPSGGKEAQPQKGRKLSTTHTQSQQSVAPMMPSMQPRISSALVQSWQASQAAPISVTHFEAASTEQSAFAMGLVAEATVARARQSSAKTAFIVVSLESGRE